MYGDKEIVSAIRCCIFIVQYSRASGRALKDHGAVRNQRAGKVFPTAFAK